MLLRGKDSGPMTFYEQQVNLQPYEGVFSKYARLTVNVGYIVLFAPAFPLASLVCFLSLLWETRADAHKLLISTQRPLYSGANSIGAWSTVLWIIGLVGVFTNVGIIGYTSSSLSAALPLRIRTKSTRSVPRTTIPRVPLHMPRPLS